MELDFDEYQRYGRQMLVAEVGKPGQMRLKASKVLVVGAGGLGCPAIAYLAGAGVGTLGIVDPDIVEESNLHRQILHRQVGQAKAESAASFVRERYPNVNVNVWCEALNSVNALEIVSLFDFILDCTDKPSTRYLVNDASVLCGKPLVSASALRGDGQLAVYNFRNGPCYRCLFPRPPPAHTVLACGDGGILGPVVGTMGVLQATEVIKVIIGYPEWVPQLLIYSAFHFPPFRSMRIRSRQANCEICGDNPTIVDLNRDYADICRVSTEIHVGERENASILKDFGGKIIDVRPEVQFGICALPFARNIPLDTLRKAASLQEIGLDEEDDVITVCRFGNDSQIAAAHLRGLGLLRARDVAGGLHAWSTINPSFPMY